MLPDSLDSLAIFFRTAQWPLATERRPTFFSIAGYAHYENVMSNVYQFFFDSNNPHGLDNLCVDALLDIVKSKGKLLNWPEHVFRHVHAIREQSVGGKQRLDLLLHNGPERDKWQKASAVILIENKVYHYLSNDLDNYWNSINNASIINQSKLGIVLGLRPQLLPENWQYITHSEWATAVEKRLGYKIYRAEPRYVTLLLELIENIRTVTNNNDSFKDLFIFFQKHRAEIRRAEKIRNEAMQQFPTVLKEIFPNDYQVSINAEGKREGWLWIDRIGNHPLRYVLGYYEVFHNNEETDLNYHIAQVISSHDHEEAKKWRDVLAAKSEAASHQLAPSNRHYILGKTYQLSENDYHRLPQLIVDNLLNDWYPLEQYWVNSQAKT